MENYDSPNTGAQFDEAVAAALNPDSSPTASSGALVTSGGVDAAIAVETSRAMAAEAALAPKASPAFSGSPTAPTPAQSNNSNRIATTAFVAEMAAGVKGFAQPEAIQANADLNSYEICGVFFCTTTPSQSVAHNPIPGTAFVMQVMARDASVNGVQQVIFGSDGNLYLRTSYSGTWSSWYRIAGTPV